MGQGVSDIWRSEIRCFSFGKAKSSITLRSAAALARDTRFLLSNGLHENY
jgi:hypothetical protein